MVDKLGVSRIVLFAIVEVHWRSNSGTIDRGTRK